jgi:hypothetical protein
MDDSVGLIGTSLRGGTGGEACSPAEAHPVAVSASKTAARPSTFDRDM